MHDYVELRLEQARASPILGFLNQAIRQSYELQASLWRHALAAAAQDPYLIPTGLFIRALNESIDPYEKRLAAARNRIPGAVFGLLYEIAAVAIGFSGDANGSQGRGGRIPVMIAGAMIATVIGMISDPDQSLRGFITLNQRAMEDLRPSLDQ